MGAPRDGGLGVVRGALQAWPVEPTTQGQATLVLCQNLCHLGGHKHVLLTCKQSPWTVRGAAVSYLVKGDRRNFKKDQRVQRGDECLHYTLWLEMTWCWKKSVRQSSTGVSRHQAGSEAPVLTVCRVKIKSSPVAAPPRGHQVQNEGYAPPLQFVIVTQKNI